MISLAKDMIWHVQKCNTVSEWLHAVRRWSDLSRRQWMCLRSHQRLSKERICSHMYVSFDSEGKSKNGIENCRVNLFFLWEYFLGKMSKFQSSWWCVSKSLPPMTQHPAMWQHSRILHLRSHNSLWDWLHPQPQLWRLRRRWRMLVGQAWLRLPWESLPVQEYTGVSKSIFS